MGLKAAAAAAALVVAIKLILKPLLVFGPTLAMGMTAIETQILILEAAMPSALLTVVLCNSYGCDAKLASKLVFTTSVVSAVSLPLMFRLLA